MLWGPVTEAVHAVCRFTYQLLQGFDFVHMARHHGVRVQVSLCGILGWQILLDMTFMSLSVLPF